MPAQSDERSPETIITPAMIAAGEYALQDYLGHGIHEYDPAEIVREIYSAMCLARPEVLHGEFDPEDKFALFHEAEKKGSRY